MDSENIEQLFRVLGSDSKVNYSSGWVNGSCPFAPYRHKKGSDRHPSFGISVHPDRYSFARCYSCGLTTDLKTLLWHLLRLRGWGDWYLKACKLVMREKMSEEEIDRRIQFADNPNDRSLASRFARVTYAFDSPPVPRGGGSATVLKVDDLKYDIIAEEELAPLRELSAEAYDYLTGERRKLQPLTLKLWELGWQPQARRVVIPVRDWHGKLVCLSGRCLDHKVGDGWEHEREPKFLHGAGFHRDYFLFGEHLVRKGETGILVEGHFDAIYLRQQGYANAVAVMGSYLSKIQVEKIVTMFSDVLIFPDGDEPGGKAAERWEYVLKGRLPVKVLTVDTDRDPDDYDDEELLRVFGFDNSLPTCYSSRC